jgi:hypothetical protein
VQPPGASLRTVNPLLRVTFLVTLIEARYVFADDESKTNTKKYLYL